MSSEAPDGGHGKPSPSASPSPPAPVDDSSGTKSEALQVLRVEEIEEDRAEEMPRKYKLRRAHSSDSLSSDEFELLDKLPPIDEKHLSTTTALPHIPKSLSKDYSEKFEEYARQRASTEKLDGSEGSADGDAGTAGGEPEYPGQRTRMLIVLAILLAAFLSALDRTIISTAIPQITDEFHSLDDIGWYGSSFMLTASCFQLILGRVYSFYTPKYIFLVCMLIFEIGSLLCAIAPSSIVFIIGRAVAGLGTAGIMSGAIIMMVATIPLEQRPLYQGLFGAVFGASSVAGPLIGGAFTTNVSWRWCFYLNLPVGAASIILLIFVLPRVKPTEPGLTIRQQLGRLDLVGEMFLLPAIICLLLALQWGGSTYEYGNWRIIMLYVIFAISLAGFVAVQALMPKSATVPGGVINNRSMIAATFFTITISGAMIMCVYFLPLWFQAIKDTTALQSGIDIIPTIIASVVGSVLAGGLVAKLGYYTPFMILGSVGGAVGCGLLATFTIHTPSSKWIGYQVILGFCLGAGMQQGSLVAQTVLKKEHVNMGISLLFLTQQIGSAIFLSVGENVFSHTLLNNLQKKIPGLKTSSITSGGATDIRKLVPPEYLEIILVAYNGAIRQVFIVGVILAGVSALGACLVEFKSVKKAKAMNANIDKNKISKPIPQAQMPAELQAKPALRKSYLNRPLPVPPTRPSTMRPKSFISERMSQRMSQALTAVISEYDIPEMPKPPPMPTNPPIARVRHVAELRRSVRVPERARSNSRTSPNELSDHYREHDEEYDRRI